MQHYFIDLDKSRYKVNEYREAALKYDLKHFGFKNYKQLNDNNFKVFNSKNKADDYLKKFNKVKDTLNNKKICKSRLLPAMLYKRKYLIQSILGEKMTTVRKYKKDWKRGQLFNLHDQTFFLTVQLISIKDIEKDGKTLYEYKFKIPS